MIYENTGPSGAKLAWLLNTSLAKPYNNEDRNIRLGKACKRPVKLPFPINFGCGRKYIPENSLNYNSEQAQDKLFCFEQFQKNGIPYPQLVTDPINYPKSFLGRRNKSSQGNGIVKFKPRSENWNKFKSDFFVEYVDVEKEFRVHVIKGMAVLEFNKRFGKEHAFIHSSRFGSKLQFGPLDHPERFKIVKAACDAIFVCGLDYGAVDIIVEKETGRWLILEVNSAPCLAHEIGYYYADRFAQLLDIKLNKWWRTTGTGKIIDDSEFLKQYGFKKHK